MQADTLAGDLYGHLCWWLSECHPVRSAFADGRSYQWVMDASWLNECRRMAMEMGGYYASLLPAVPEYLLGLPVDVRDDGGVPHLELVAP